MLLDFSAPDSSTIQTITEYLAIEAPTSQADLAFVLGTRSPQPAQIAADLIAAGRIAVVVLTGGLNRHTGRNEAQDHWAVLQAAGIVQEKVILEDRSSNTLENVLFALPLIDTAWGIAAIRSIIVIAKWYHCRRAVMTLRRHFPPSIRYYTHTYAPNGVAPDNWFLTEHGIKIVLKNYQSIPRYLEKGHISPIDKVDDAFM